VVVSFNLLLRMNCVNSLKSELCALACSCKQVVGEEMYCCWVPVA